MNASTPSPADSLDTLYKGHHSGLLGWLRRRLDCPHNAADMAQETFLRLQVSIKTVQTYLVQALLQCHAASDKGL
jgi:DNA-directed RNA polymerase specialized sigma24 family protein